MWRRTGLSLILGLVFLLSAGGQTTDDVSNVDTGCCQLAGDANDDGVVNIYDYFFTLSWGYQAGVLDRDYPGPPMNGGASLFCYDQMVPGTSVGFLSSIAGYNQIDSHLVADGEPVCGERGY